MTLIAALRVTRYAREHRQAFLELCGASQWTHEHLDWFSLGQWLDQERGALFVAWQGAELLGYLGLSQPVAGCAWIRLLGIRDGRLAERTIAELWQLAEAYCRRMQARRVACLMVTNWLANYLAKLGFASDDEVITLCHIACSPPSARSAPARLRYAELDDLPAIAKVDRLAFAPLWRLSQPEIWQAMRLNALARVALVDGQPVAYQISMLREDIGHLARLAVHPAYQGKGIGGLLLNDFLRECQRRSLREVSVNTQLSNAPSQGLYERFGFFRNYMDRELWSKDIA